MSKKKTFGEQFKDYRKINGLSQGDVSFLTGLHPAVVSFYETGQRKPGIDSIVTLCRGLKCTPNDLIDIDSYTTK